MNDYMQVKISVEPCNEAVTDVLASYLADIGYESFVPGTDGLTAYIQQSLFDAEALNRTLDEFPLEVRCDYAAELVPGQDWNEEWEKNYFKPIAVEDKCIIHSSFHTDVPKAQYDILIDPKMAFGTGHHETTSLMLSEILHADIAGKNVLDMGCGTAVLAILARMCGAARVTAIDIDEFAYENAVENVRLNGVADSISVRLGGSEQLGDETYDLVFANINRNILLDNMRYYVAYMNPGARIYMSGFYEQDIPSIREEAERNGLRYVHHHEKKQWVSVCFEKI